MRTSLLWTALVATHVLAQVDYEPTAPLLKITLDDDIAARVVNGVNATNGRYPYYALVYVQSAKEAWVCGGVLIHPQVVATAGHCWGANVEARAYVGASGILTSGVVGETMIRAKKFVRHNNYKDLLKKSNKINNDISLMLLTSPVQNAKTAKLAVAPSSATTSDLDQTVIGIGRTITGDLSGQLQEGGVKSYSTADCTAKIRSMLFIKKYSLAPDEICTYDPTRESNGLGTGPCLGDSGGPLITKGSTWSNDVVNGLTSWVFLPCGTYRIPSVFTKIGYHQSWITSTLKKWKISTKPVHWV